MVAAALHPKEDLRLRELRDLEILDSLPESEYQDIVELASAICGTPVSLVSLVDQSRQWFKAKVGLDIAETPREISFCAHAILDLQVMEIPDARQDARFLDNPVVTGAPGVVFYAGAPLVSPGGLPLGTLCVVDFAPRKLTDHQRVALERLSRQLTQLLHLRLELAKMRQLSHELSFYRTSVKHMNDGVVLQDPDGRVRSFNPRLLEILGITEAELAAGGLDATPCHYALGDGRRLAPSERPWTQAMSKGQPQRDVELALLAPETATTRAWVRVSSEPIAGAHEGRATATVTTVTDVTEQKLSQARVLEASRMAAVGELSASIAHEINTPLAVIAASADFLRLGLQGTGSGRSAEPARLLEKVQKIEETALRVSDVLRHMHGLLGTHRGRQPETLSLGTLACECLTVCSERFRSRGIPLKLEILQSPAVHCVPSDMNQVLIHLLNNAYEAVVDREDRWVKVLVDTASDGRMAELRVMDSGRGISEDLAATMMQPFVTTKSPARHTGVGLSTASTICELLGGSLRYESYHGHTSFVVTLPRAHVIRGRGAHAA